MCHYRATRQSGIFSFTDDRTRDQSSLYYTKEVFVDFIFAQLDRRQVYFDSLMVKKKGGLHFRTVSLSFKDCRLVLMIEKGHDSLFFFFFIWLHEYKQVLPTHRRKTKEKKKSYIGCRKTFPLNFAHRTFFLFSSCFPWNFKKKTCFIL